MSTPTLLGEQVYQQIRVDIQNGVIRPGRRITEEWAAAHYSASRTPVREACRRLAEEGLLTHEPRRGFRVPPVSAREIDELYDLRRVLEVHAARRAAAASAHHADVLDELRRTWETQKFKPGEQVVYNDEQFHRTLATIGGNGQLVLLLDAISARIRFFRMNDFLHRDRIATTKHQHVQILAAISDGDGDLAAALLHAHISESQRAVLDAVAAVSSTVTPAEPPRT